LALRAYLGASGPVQWSKKAKTESYSDRFIGAETRIRRWRGAFPDSAKSAQFSQN
jgi:hypothetical protein